MQTTPEQPLRVAVVGAGPAAFYVVQHLLQGKGLQLRVDMFERLPTPYGLVRHGVAPDHQKIKTVTAVYQKLGQRPEFRFFGNVEFGTDLSLDDLLGHYHQVVFATGAQTDRRLGIPGEDLPGSHPATEFVAWYNGHPDYARLAFDLGCRSAVVIGAGNVAVDVARILCRTPDELARTDIADYALEALGRSRIEEVSLVGRRGPAQAAFTNPEVRELGELEGAEPLTLPDEVELDPLTREALDRDEDKTVRRKVEILQGYASRREPRPRRLWLRFLLSPTEILAGPDGRVAGVRFVRNVLCPGGDSELKARATDTFEELPAGLVFRSVGYRGVPLPGLPFRDDMGTIPAAAGRVLAAPGGAPLRGVCDRHQQARRGRDRGVDARGRRARGGLRRVGPLDRVTPRRAPGPPRQLRRVAAHRRRRDRARCTPGPPAREVHRPAEPAVLPRGVTSGALRGCNPGAGPYLGPTDPQRGRTRVHWRRHRENACRSPTEP
jgi:ferredoxin--NADP+ reductase